VLRRLLAAPDTCASVGRNLVNLPDHPEAQPLFAAFEDANRRRWDRKLPLADHEAARRDWHEAAERIGASAAFSGSTHLVLKRSFPFRGVGRYYFPDLWDVVDLPGDSRITMIYREPCAAVYSAFRRGFDSDLRRLAALCGEQLTWIAGQVRAIGAGRVRVVSYRQLCETPDLVLEPLTAFCGIPFAPVSRAARDEGMDPDTDRRYARELPPANVAWLEGFFGARRRQWDILERPA
jgi:hypothetical protein